MIRVLLVSAAMFVSMTAFAQQFTPTSEPIAPDGTKAVCDIPNNQHIQNVGGSDGAGLCVYSSVNLSFRWHNMPELDDFQNWMRRRPGGGWPEKLDKMLAQFCREKGVPIPMYIQHTGGDDSFLDLAVKTDRPVAVTYAGNDDFYRGSVAHMVLLCHIDSKWAAIADNNRVKKLIWMSRSDFLKRWRAMSGGWAVVFLASPPPPHLEAKAFNALPETDKPCICGDNCKCEKDKCPNKCPVSFGQCPGGKCPSVTPIARPNTFRLTDDLKLADGPVGNPPTPDHEWGQFDDGRWGWRLKEKVTLPVLPGPAPVPEVVDYGVDSSRIHAGKRYTLPNGVEISEGKAHDLMTGDSKLEDDSNRWHLTVVGDDAFCKQVKAHWEKLPVETRARMHVQFYSPDHWAVTKYSLPVGVSLRKPSPVRTSEQVGVVSKTEYAQDKLTTLLDLMDGKLPVIPTPVPQPAPTPKPDPAPIGPLPSPIPDPKPLPAPQLPDLRLLLLVAGILYLLFRKK